MTYLFTNNFDKMTIATVIIKGLVFFLIDIIELHCFECSNDHIHLVVDNFFLYNPHSKTVTNYIN